MRQERRRDNQQWILDLYAVEILGNPGADARLYPRSY